jgi:hypothetical protein
MPIGPLRRAYAGVAGSSSRMNVVCEVSIIDAGCGSR